MANQGSTKLCRSIVLFNFLYWNRPCKHIVLVGIWEVPREENKLKQDQIIYRLLKHQNWMK